jgi:putative transcriptional regulator
VKSRLRVLRAERSWTQEHLADMVDVSRQAINALETERHEPSLDLAHRIAAAFALPVEDIFPNPYRERTER